MKLSNLRTPDRPKTLSPCTLSIASNGIHIQVGNRSLEIHMSPDEIIEFSLLWQKKFSKPIQGKGGKFIRQSLPDLSFIKELERHENNIEIEFNY